ncbi:hypothetical protein FHW16_000959 [Phyllobacterium myrsinacearum]|uniref:Uncharacterized protein n=1 Tax=Phyllobacterium myrsinacearum TaxID=28101 RepID=A0A839ELA5_9HYPH|nr:hypothetical protein [Phyllobacterium myrsinacearum]
MLSVVLFHPDYTVGFGIAPKSADLSGNRKALAGSHLTSFDTQ